MLVIYLKDEIIKKIPNISLKASNTYVQNNFHYDPDISFKYETKNPTNNIINTTIINLRKDKV